MQSRWILSPPEELNGGPISWSEICGSDCIARLLLRKGFGSAPEVESFLRPRLNSLGDPFLLPQMDVAVRRILDALDRRERIVLFGDYDVDGVASLALLSELLRASGGSPELFLPSRIEEGYGLSRESVERCLVQFRPQLLIAVDCGTSSIDEIASLRERGVEVIVLDHHEPKRILPECVAIVNPKTDPDCRFHYLCSAGVVFKLCHAFLKTRALPGFDLKAKLDLVALATVADIVPLQDENRIFVQRGSNEIARTRRPGLQKLKEVAAIRSPVLAEHIAFRLGPRLNAAGRLSNAEKALRLLLTEDESDAAELAGFLDKQNRDRQEVEKQMLSCAEDQIEKKCDLERDAAIVVGARDWHPGVLGIVASRIARKYHRPTIVVGFDDSGLGKGSGRSINGLHLVKTLERCAGFLEKFGGHEMAAGLTIHEDRFEPFRDAFRLAARESLSDEDLQPRLHLDHELSFSQINVGLLRWHEMLQPFGNSNPQPLFLARDVEPAGPAKVMKEKHLSLPLRQGNAQRKAVYFQAAAEQLPAPPWDVAFRIGPDDFDGERLVQVQIHALRTAAPID